MEKSNGTGSKLALWQGRAARGEALYSGELRKMDQREAQYRGDDRLRPLVERDEKGQAVHVRNLTGEMIEAQVDSTIPQPKVTARRPEDVLKAKLIEDMLRAELDRMPFETFNDMMARTVPIQGGGFFLVEWDEGAGSHNTSGELKVVPLHPKQVLPQEGVYTGIEDMDYLILRLPQTRAAIERTYDVSLGVNNPGEEEETVTQYIAYYRDENGHIGKFSWVEDQILEDLADYQARRACSCKDCGTWVSFGEACCPACEGTDFEVLPVSEEPLSPMAQRSDGTRIPGISGAGSIPVYRPGLYPVIEQKNVSLYGAFLGDSDVDKIRDQQNTANRVESKIIDKLLKSGSYMTLPPDADIEISPEEMKVIRLSSPAGKQMIGVYDMQGNVNQDTDYLEQVYQEARQIIGITDSLQGRRDTTATSGKAKEFAAAQSAGRLESKRVMKNAAYAALFEAMFKFKLAYTDESRPIPSKDIQGNPEFKVFSRYDFLEQDEAGAWYWNDQFLFSCDTTAPLAANREAMWQETTANFQSGAFGDPAAIETLILFWKKMEMLHYPGAGETRAVLEDKQQNQLMTQPAAALPMA